MRILVRIFLMFLAKKITSEYTNFNINSISNLPKNINEK